MTELKYSDQELIDMLHLASSDESKSDGMLYRIAARRICECMKRDANYWHRIMQRSDLQAYKIRELEAKLERVGELPKSWMPVLTSNENGQITATRRVLTPGQCAIELQAALKEERT